MLTQRIAVTPDSAYTGACTQLVRTLPDAPEGCSASDPVTSSSSSGLTRTTRHSGQ
jgi:hypothetical protein